MAWTDYADEAGAVAGTAIGGPGGAPVGAAVGKFLGGLFGGGKGDCPGQLSTEATQYMLSRLNPAERTQLAEAWRHVVRTEIPWHDPRKLAQQARGGNGCKLDGTDHVFAQAFASLAARYPHNPAAAPVPAYTGGASAGGPVPQESPTFQGGTIPGITVTGAPSPSAYGGSSAAGAASGPLGVPVWVLALVIAAAAFFYLRKG